VKKILTVFVCLFASALAAAYSVTFNWQQSKSPGIVADKLYCGKISGGPYPYSHQTSYPTTTLEVPKAPPGTYYCVVTAINSLGDESAPSNEVKVQIP